MHTQVDTRAHVEHHFYNRHMAVSFQQFACPLAALPKKKRRLVKS